MSLALGGGLLVALSSALVALSWVVLTLSALGLVGYTGATFVFGSMTLFFSATTAVAGVAVLSGEVPASTRPVFLVHCKVQRP